MQKKLSLESSQIEVLKNKIAKEPAKLFSTWVNNLQLLLPKIDSHKEILNDLFIRFPCPIMLTKFLHSLFFARENFGATENLIKFLLKQVSKFKEVPTKEILYLMQYCIISNNSWKELEKIRKSFIKTDHSEQLDLWIWLKGKVKIHEIKAVDIKALLQGFNKDVFSDPLKFIYDLYGNSAILSSEELKDLSYLEVSQLDSPLPDENPDDRQKIDQIIQGLQVEIGIKKRTAPAAQPRWTCCWSSGVPD